MRIEKVMAGKGAAVATVTAASTVRQALTELARHRIGALVVSPDGKIIEGIVSERDVVRALEQDGPEIIDRPVSSIMSTDLYTCRPEDEVDSIMALMTAKRIRHVPVLQDGALAGIVSIGDVVKSRIDELEGDRKALVDFIYAR